MMSVPQNTDVVSMHPEYVQWSLVRMSACVKVMLVGIAGMSNAAQAGKAVDPELYAFIARCAPTVHPETMAAVISTESRGHQFAIADAGPVRLPWSQRKHMVRSFYLNSAEEAVAKATELIAKGHTVSLGLSQINDRNLKRLNLSIRDVFNPCTNIAAGGQILTQFYQKALREFGPGTRALRAALSGYNSGNWVRGEQDGYVDIVYRQVGVPLAIKTQEVAVKTPTNARKNLSYPGFTQAAGTFAMSSGHFVVN